MVIFRSVTLNHTCSGGSCNYCTTGYGPPPPNPEEHLECCRYTENGERVVVVYVDVPVGLKSAPTRPTRSGARAAAGKKAPAKKLRTAKLRDVELQPKSPAREPSSRTRSAPATRKPAASKTTSATRRGKTR